MAPTSMLLLMLTICLSACGAGWRRLENVSPETLPPRAQVQVWQGTQQTVLHWVEIGTDSIYGVPFIQPPSCDTCRVGTPLERVDSLRLGNKERGFIRAARVGLVVLLGLVYLFQGVGGN